MMVLLVLLALILGASLVAFISCPHVMVNPLPPCLLRCRHNASSHSLSQTTNPAKVDAAEVDALGGDPSGATPFQQSSTTSIERLELANFVDPESIASVWIDIGGEG